MGDVAIGYKAEDMGVDVDGAIYGVQSFVVDSQVPTTPIFQLGSLEGIGVAVSALRLIATLTRNSTGTAVITGAWTDIIDDRTRAAVCPLYGVSSAVCSAVTLSGRIGSPPTETWTFTGTTAATGGAAIAGSGANIVQAVDIVIDGSRGAGYTVTASCTLNFLEEYDTAALVGIICEQPRVVATLERFASSASAIGTVYTVGSTGTVTITVGGMTLTLDEAVSTNYGGRGTVGGFATYSHSYFGGGEGSSTGGLTIA